MDVATVENSLVAPRKWNMELACDSAIFLLGIHPKELKAEMQTDTHEPIVHHSQKMKQLTCWKSMYTWTFRAATIFLMNFSILGDLSYFIF